MITITAKAIAHWRQPYDTSHITNSRRWKELADYLLAEGFVYIEYDGLGTDIFQRKTPHTNLIAQVYGDAVTLYHGAATVNKCYGCAVDAEGLRILLACAEVEQVVGA